LRRMMTPCSAIVARGQAMPLGNESPRQVVGRDLARPKKSGQRLRELHLGNGASKTSGEKKSVVRMRNDTKSVARRNEPGAGFTLQGMR